MVIVLLVVQAQSAIWCGRKQQDLCAVVILCLEQMTRKLSRFRFLREQMLKSLKFVQNNQVGFQRFETHMRQQPA